MRHFIVTRVHDHRETGTHEFVKVDLRAVFSRVLYTDVQMFKEKAEGLWRQMGAGGYDFTLAEDVDGLLMSQQAEAALNALNTSKVEKDEPQVGHCGSEAGQ